MLYKFLRLLFSPSRKSIEEQRDKLLILSILTVAKKDPGHGTVPFPVLYEKFSKKRNLPVKQFSKILNALTRDGFVQKIDGGNKSLPEDRVCYIISPDGLNEFRYSLSV